jgi:glycosyltransferase involved in cell wall biosynthesis
MVEFAASNMRNETSDKGPLVSVCIASYNHCRFLPAAIDSVLNQTFKDVEIIITDDGSRDGSLELLREYESRFPSKIHVFTHEGHVNRGIAATFNVSLRKARGQYIACTGSDDIWVSTKLAEQLQFIEANPSVGFVYSRALVIDQDGVETGRILGEDLSLSDDSLARLIYENPIPAPSVILPRECAEKIGIEHENVVYSDWEMWIRLLAHYRAGFIDRPLLLYRVHSYNTSIGIARRFDLKRQIEMLERVRERAPIIGGQLAHSRYPALISKRISELKCQYARAQIDHSQETLRHGEIGEAISSIRQAFASSPAEAMRPRRVAAMFKSAIAGFLKLGSTRENRGT